METTPKILAANDSENESVITPKIAVTSDSVSESIITPKIAITSDSVSESNITPKILILYNPIKDLTEIINFNTSVSFIRNKVYDNTITLIDFRTYATSCNENRTQLQPFNQRSSIMDKVHDGLEITRHKDASPPCTINTETYEKHKFGTNEDTETYYSKF